MEELQSSGRVSERFGRDLQRLVAGMAHELNTPAGAMRSSAETLERAVERLNEGLGDADNASVHRAMTAIRRSQQAQREAVDRINQVVRSLAAFARLDEASVTFVCVESCLKRTLSMLEPSLAGRAEVSCHFSKTPHIPIQGNDLHELFFAVLQNAIDATGPAGHIEIHTREEDGQVVIEVRDNGCGIAEQHLERVFEPGFTTRMRGVGVGLGLPIARRIAEGHGGSIALRSQVGVGTTCTIRLSAALWDA